MSDKEQEVSKEVLEKATKQGWVEKSAWKGDPSMWRPAKEFVERGENIVPILQDRISKLESDFKTTVGAQQAELKRVKEEAYERAKSEYENKKTDLDAKELEAFNTSDTEAYQEVKKQRDKLKEPEKPVEQPVTNNDFEEWHKKNEWFAPDVENPGKADLEATDYANRTAQSLLAKTPNIPPEQLFSRVEKVVRKRFPDKFENPNRKKATMVDSGSHAGESETKSWGDLPQEAKTAYKRAAQRVKNVGGELKKEDFVNDYFEATA